MLVKKIAVLGSVALLAFGFSMIAGRTALAETSVTCPPGSNLQNAINAAPSGATLNITGTCTGNFTISKSLTLIGGTLDGNNSGNVLHIDSGVTVVLKDVTVQHANATSFPGGIYNIGTLTVVSSTVSDNTAGSGGGIYNDVGGTLTVVSSTLSHNTANPGAGGGIENNGGTVTVKSSIVSDNTSYDLGGGIFNQLGTLSLASSGVSGNTATFDGGGIYNLRGTLSLASSGVSGNTTTFDGGGIYNDHGTVTNRGSSLSGNTPNNCAPPGSVPGCTG